MSGRKSDSDKGLPLRIEVQCNELHNTGDLHSQYVDLIRRTNERIVLRTAGTAESEEEWYTITTQVVKCEGHRENSSDSEYPVIEISDEESQADESGGHEVRNTIPSDGPERFTITTHLVECEGHRENSSDLEYPVIEISDEENQADESGGHEVRNTIPSDAPKRIQRQPFKLSKTWSLVDRALLQKAIEGIIDEYLPKTDKGVTIKTSNPFGEVTCTQQFSGSEEGTTGLQPTPANELMFADLLVQLLSRVDRDSAQELTRQRVFLALLQVATDCRLMLKNDESRDGAIQITRLADEDQTDEPGNDDTNENEENCGGTSEKAT